MLLNLLCRDNPPYSVEITNIIWLSPCYPLLLCMQRGDGLPAYQRQLFIPLQSCNLGRLPSLSQHLTCRMRTSCTTPLVTFQLFCKSRSAQFLSCDRLSGCPLLLLQTCQKCLAFESQIAACLGNRPKVTSE